MARILQDTDPGPILHSISETSPSSSVVFVGGNFTMTIADSLTATVLTILMKRPLPEDGFL